MVNIREEIQKEYLGTATTINNETCQRKKQISSTLLKWFHPNTCLFIFTLKTKSHMKDKGYTSEYWMTFSSLGNTYITPQLSQQWSPTVTFKRNSSCGIVIYTIVRTNWIFWGIYLKVQSVLKTYDKLKCIVIAAVFPHIFFLLNMPWNKKKLF